VTTRRRDAVARVLGAVGLLIITRPASNTVSAQQARDSTRCDSVVAAARVDSVNAGLFISAARRSGDPLTTMYLNYLTARIVSTFVPPKPFRLTVFEGPPLMRALRPRADTAPQLRAPTVTGVYRAISTQDSGLVQVKVVRASLMPGFDEAAIEAIRTAGVYRQLFTPPDDEDSLTIDVRISSDSVEGSRRFVAASFPRMPVVDAVAFKTNPVPGFPVDAKLEGLTAGEVVLRFVVDRTGHPAMETIEVVRETSSSFLLDAIDVMPGLRFTPASVRGCAVAQTVDYAFSFLLPVAGPIGASGTSRTSRKGPRLRH